MFQSEERAIKNNLDEAQGRAARPRPDRSSTSSRPTTTLGAGGKSIVEEQYVNLGSMLNQKQLRLGDLNQQMMLMESFPKLDQSPEAARRNSMHRPTRDGAAAVLTEFLANHEEDGPQLQLRSGEPNPFPESSRRSWMSSTS